MPDLDNPTKYARSLDLAPADYDAFFEWAASDEVARLDRVGDRTYPCGVVTLVRVIDDVRAKHAATILPPGPRPNRDQWWIVVQEHGAPLRAYRYGAIATALEDFEEARGLDSRYFGDEPFQPEDYDETEAPGAVITIRRNEAGAIDVRAEDGEGRPTDFATFKDEADYMAAIRAMIERRL